MQLFGLQLDHDLDHIHGLYHAGCDHAREPTDPERLDEVNSLLPACLLYLGHLVSLDYNSIDVKLLTVL